MKQALIKNQIRVDLNLIFFNRIKWGICNILPRPIDISKANLARSILFSGKTEINMK